MPPLLSSSASLWYWLLCFLTPSGAKSLHNPGNGPPRPASKQRSPSTREPVTPSRPRSAKPIKN